MSYGDGRYGSGLLVKDTTRVSWAVSIPGIFHVSFWFIPNQITTSVIWSSTHHKIGHVDQFDAIALDTAYHFSTRSQCPRCPVVQLCKGACLFLEGEFWDAACDNAFSHNLAVMAAALYYQTQGLILTRIESDAIRYDTVSVVDVVKLAFVDSGGDMGAVVPLKQERRPFPVAVVAA